MATRPLMLRLEWVAQSIPFASACGLAALLLLGIGMAEISRQQAASAQLISHALRVLARAATVRADLATVASESLTALVDRTDENPTRFRQASEQTQIDTARLRDAVADEPVQAAAADRLMTAVAARIASLQQDTAAPRTGEPAIGRDREPMDRLLASIRDIEDAERLAFRRRVKAAQTTQQLLVATLVGGAVLGVASVVLAFALWRQRHREQLHLAELAASDAERRRTETALRESEARLRTAADTIPSHLFETDAAGACLYANPALLDYSGLPLEQFAPDFALGLSHPDDRVTVASCLQQAETGTPYEIEARFRRRDGVYRWFLVRGAPVRDPAGQIIRWVGTATDIDDQKHAATVLARHRDELERLVADRTAELAASEAKLRDTAARFRSIAEHSSDVVVRVAADGAYNYVSSASQHLLGLRPDQLTAEFLLSRVHPEDRHNIVAMRKRLLEGTAETETVAFRISHADGHLAWFEAAARALNDPATGKLDGYVSLLRDLTERRKRDETLRHAHRMEIIGRIASGVAHDFNNLLQTVISGLELTLDRIDDNATARECAHLALGAATRGSSLTHHLLSYARKQVLQPRTVALGPFLTDLQKLLSRTLGPHIDVRLDVSPDAAPVHLDLSQLQTALLNLAINAADAMGEGGTLTLRAEPAGVETGERLVALSVQDEGAGMDDVTLALACEPFYTTKGAGGTGLGLSMVQGFVEQSGGILRLESKPGRGTTVLMVFQAAPGPVARPPDLATLPQPSRRVLVVDDEPDILVTAGAFLECAGLWVVRASSGNEALAHLAGDIPFDALVTDYAMPGMNGAALAVESQSIRPGLPVLIITGFVEIQGIEDLPDHTRMLQKPFLRDDLLRALQDVMTAAAKRAETVSGTARKIIRFGKDPE